MSLLQLISSDSFVVASKPLIKKYGLIEANIIGLFASIHNFTIQTDPAANGWFYATYEKIEEDLNISKHISSKAIEYLIQEKVLIDKKQGVPCRRFFKFNELTLFNSLKLKNLTTGSEKIELQEDKNFNFKQENNLISSSEVSLPQAVEELNRNNNINKNITSFSKKEKFEKPDLEKIKKIFLENNFKSDPEKFLAKLKLEDWKGINSSEKLIARAEYWELTFKDKNPQKYVESPIGVKIAPVTKDTPEIIALRARIKHELGKINKHAAWHHFSDNIEKIDGIYYIYPKHEEAHKYSKVLENINVKIKS